MSPSGVHTHQALFYRDGSEYLEGLERFLAPARAASEPVALALPGPKRKTAERLVGSWPEAELVDMLEVGRNPGRLLPFIQSLREQHRGRTLHYVGEPIWPGRHPDEIREAVRHEALVNLALGGSDTRVLCPYDAANLEPSVLAYAERTHPTVVDRGLAHESVHYCDAVPAECDSPLSAPPSDAVACEIEGGSLATVRAMVRDFGQRAKLGAELLDDLVVVANELATNALVHGGPPRRLLVWQASGDVFCQGESEGTLLDPLAGRHRIGPEPGHGRGLWIVHHLSDLVEARAGKRTIVRARLAAA